ncbi:MAG: site-specific integrase [Formivibrio sp.]|nr:site-specific integrase [Formivibrio sp.]
MKGKLIRRSLKTDQISVAKLRLADLEKSERQKIQSLSAVANGKMTFGDVLAVFKQRMQDNPEVKPKTKEYYKFRISALLKSWPELENKDVSRITNSECLDWSVKSANKNSSSSHNHTVSILRKVFAIAMETGARYDNPALSARRTRERTKKQIKLPDFGQFEKLVAEVGRPVNGFAKPAAELVQFLAYGGLRIGEAKFVTWADCDLQRGEITVRGNPDTGLKGRNVGEFRIVPMIPDMRKLLERMRADRPDETPNTPVMRVWECQKSIDRASKLLGIIRFTHHDLRHYFATVCIESDVPIPTVAQWVGHKDGGAMLMRIYGHLRNEHSQKMAGQVTFTSAPEKGGAGPPQRTESVTKPLADSPETTAQPETVEPIVDASVGY